MAAAGAAAACLLTEQGVPAWPELRRSCGYSPPGFFPAPPVSIFLPPTGVTRCSVRAGYSHKDLYVHTYTRLPSKCHTLSHHQLALTRAHTHTANSFHHRSLFSLSLMTTLWHSLQSIVLKIHRGAKTIKKLWAENMNPLFFLSLPLLP